MICKLLLITTLAVHVHQDAGNRVDATARQLIRQLDDDSLQRRVEAERRLIELGTEVLNHLPPPNRRMSPELKTRLERIRHRLQQDTSLQFSLASRVTIRGTFLLSEVLRQLQEQTGNRIVDVRPRFGQRKTDPKLHLDINDMSYWDALREVLDNALLRQYGYAGQPHALAILNRPPNASNNRHIMVSGPFQIEVNRLRAERDLRTATGNLLTVSLEISWEPRLQPIILTQRLDTIAAQDENADAIPLTVPPATREIPVPTTAGSVEVEIPLKLPPRTVRRIASLRGKLDALLLGGTAEFKFDELDSAANVEQRYGGVTVVLSSVRKLDKGCDVHLRIRFDNALGALESHRNWINRNEAHLRDRSGGRIENSGLETISALANEVELSYKFKLDGRLNDYSFVYITPATIIAVPVEYELRDLELP